AEFPASHWIFNTAYESTVLLLLADFEPVFNQDNSIGFHQSFECRTHPQELVVLLVGTKPHDVFDKCAVIPAAIEQYYLSRCGQFVDIALRIHLRLLPVRRSRQRHMTKDARTYPFHDPTNHAAFARCVTPFENYYDPGTICFDPLLHFD